MTTLQIPVRTDLAAYIMTVELEGLYYGVSFRFNRRDDHWYMDINHDDVRVLSGIKIVTGEDLLSQFAYLQVDGRLPPGVLSVLDVSGADDDPGRDNFGDNIVMLYEESA